MKKVLFIVLMLSIFNVFADTCSKEELARLKDIAEHVELTYEYEKKETKIAKNTYLYHEYTIVAHNLNKEIKVNYEKNYLTGDYYEFKQEGNVGKLSEFYDGETAIVTIRAYTKDACSGKELAKKTIKLPYMNQYYYSIDNCDEHMDFKYCQPLIDKKLSYEEFSKEYSKYLDSNGSEIVLNNQINRNKNNDLLIIGIVVFTLILITLLIIIIDKKKKKNSL